MRNTLGEVVLASQRLKQDPYSGEEKTQWINELQARIWTEVWERGCTAPVLDWAYDQGEPLLLPESAMGLYTAWIGAQVDYHNGEYDKYSNSMEMFNALWRAYVAQWGNRWLRDRVKPENAGRDRPCAPCSCLRQG